MQDLIVYSLMCLFYWLVCLPHLIGDITLYVPCEMRAYESVFTLANSLTVIV